MSVHVEPDGMSMPLDDTEDQDEQQRPAESAKTVPMEMLALLSCPFCGGRAERIDLDDDETDPNYGGSFIHCPDCFASSKLIFGEKIGLENAWNIRVPTGSAKTVLMDRLLKAFGDLKPSERSSWIDIDATIRSIFNENKEGKDDGL